LLFGANVCPGEVLPWALPGVLNDTIIAPRVPSHCCAHRASFSGLQIALSMKSLKGCFGTSLGSLDRLLIWQDTLPTVPIWVVMDIKLVLTNTASTRQTWKHITLIIHHVSSCLGWTSSTNFQQRAMQREWLEWERAEHSVKHLC
jgi:hypothetical protein